MGKPWLCGPEVVEQYMVFMRKSKQLKSVQHDLQKLNSLRGDSYDVFITTWNGKGPTPQHYIDGMEAVRIVYISEAFIPCPRSSIEESTEH